MDARSNEPPRTLRQRRGAAAEALVAEMLAAAGWRLLGRGVRVGRGELDLVGVDPGPPAMLVFVEVRSVATGRFGSPLESVTRGKLERTWLAAGGLLSRGILPDGSPLPGLPWRVDLVGVETGARGDHLPSGPRITHHRALAPEGSHGRGWRRR